jgi:hypothetical protein
MHIQDIPEEELHSIMKRLAPMYPQDAEKATNILLQEYEFPTQIAYLIMTMVHIQQTANSVFKWPVMDATYSVFCTN